MTGSGASGGFDFQASVTTAVMVHILRGTQLPWVRMTSRCIPEAVQAETGTPGDDILIEVTRSDIRIDVQAKKGLKRGARLNETIDAFAEGLARTTDHYLLAVDGTSSASIKEDLREDLQRMGEGRFDPLSETGREVLERVEAAVDRDEIGRLHVVELNILTDWEAARQHYIQELRLVLEDPSQAETAWEILSIESLRLIRERGRATEQTLAGVLLRRDVRLNTADEKDVVRRNASARRALDRFQQIYSDEGAAEGHVVAVRRLLDHGQPEAAAALIAEIETDAELPMSPERRSTLLSLRGVSKIRLGDLEGARCDLTDAIAHDAQNVVAHANLSALLIESGDMETAERHAVRPQKPILVPPSHGHGA